MSDNILRIVREMRRHVGGKAVVWHADPFRVLISTVLSQRTKDQNTRVAAERLFSVFDTPAGIANAPLPELERLIRPSGFYKVKAGRIREISRQIMEEFGGKVPRQRQDLLSLEGVGPKTAGCVQVYGFGMDAIKPGLVVPFVGNTYAGSTLLGLAATLDVASPGDRILAVSYGSGAGSDAFSFIVQDEIANNPRLDPPVSVFINRKRYIDYSLYSKLRGKLIK